MEWEYFAQLILGSASITAILGFIGKSVFKAYLDSDLETHKANLQRASREHAIKFENLHVTRSKVIQILYKKTVLLDDSLNETLKHFHAVSEPSIEDKIKTIAEKYNDLRDYYRAKRIFFDSSLCDKIDEALKLVMSVYLDITTYPPDIKDPAYSGDRETLKERHEFWENARKNYNEHITEIKGILEDDFRNLLGINN